MLIRSNESRVFSMYDATLCAMETGLLASFSITMFNRLGGIRFLMRPTFIGVSPMTSAMYVSATSGSWIM